ncbi:uncharacterized protein LOC122301733 [Carya illinoinensis]|uniref:uncharacterized protein LOC122301733 n=1 Tax=Carya illinoinensis TaxID=32201 RepID=UPI001C7205FC|nr:uncharacterized protein LOC122301733 [Carya illinoinensis]
MVLSEEGAVESSQKGIARTFQSFYQDLFSTSHPRNIEAALHSIQHLLSEGMNSSLTRAFTEEEVVAAIKVMNPIGSLGPDGRIISDNVVVAYELLHSMQTRLKGKSNGFMALKLDISKAYDHVEWEFLYKVMLKMGFAVTWVDLVNHLLFADDSLVFCKSNPDEWSRLQQVLSNYEQVTGQRINLDKTSIFFNSNTKQEIQRAILEQAGIKPSGPFDKYLGLPYYVGRQRIKVFSLVLDKIKTKMASWKTNDKWLPSPSTYQVQSPVNILTIKATVSELINPETMQWDLHLIHAIFSETEANLISRMTISPCRSQDVLKWRYSDNGKFSVRSAYHLQGTMMEDRRGQSSTQPQLSSFWKKIWGIQAPQATMSFMWRASRESLATNLNLHKRKVVESPLYPIYSKFPKSVTHALWTCTTAQDVWSMSSRKIQKLSILSGSFKEILMPILDQLSPLEFTEVAVTAKAIWHRRNSWLFEQQFHSPFHVSKQIHAELIVIGLWIDNGGKHSKIQVEHSTQWSAPPPDFYKAN